MLPPRINLPSRRIKYFGQIKTSLSLALFSIRDSTDVLHASFPKMCDCARSVDFTTQRSNCQFNLFKVYCSAQAAPLTSVLSGTNSLISAINNFISKLKEWLDFAASQWSSFHGNSTTSSNLSNLLIYLDGNFKLNNSTVVNGWTVKFCASYTRKCWLPNGTSEWEEKIREYN